MSNNPVTNRNQLDAKDFRLVVDGLNHVKYHAVGWSPASISSNAVKQSFPQGYVAFHGDVLSYSSFSITFILDEDGNNFMEIFNWIASYGQSHTEDYKSDPISGQRYTANEQRNQAHAKKYRDVSVFLPTNKYNGNIEMRFLEAHPTNLSMPEISTKNTSVITLECTVEFEFTTMKVTNSKLDKA